MTFFLFGPRGSGKSTWLSSAYPHALVFDFLRNDVMLRYIGQPERFRAEVENLPAGSWVVLDEVQKVPKLLDEVQSVLDRRKREVKFCLTGSSARKLRSENANLLAGRAIQKSFFPLVTAELPESVDLEHRLKFGNLPLVHAEPDSAIDTLEAYVNMYLREEIQQEALAKNLDSFARFLRIAAIMNGQVVNMAGISRDAGVPRPSVERYFSVLVDTLIGFWLPGWQPRLKVREKQSPKFYFFDPGVIRAIRGELRDPIESSERGPLLELLVLHELRAAIDYLGVGGELYYYRTGGGVEVDIIWSRARTAIGIEVKSATEWRSEYSTALQGLLESGKLRAAYGVYRGQRSFEHNGITILPFRDFAAKVFNGEIFTYRAR